MVDICCGVICFSIILVFTELIFVFIQLLMGTDQRTVKKFNPENKKISNIIPVIIYSTDNRNKKGRFKKKAQCAVIVAMSDYIDINYTKKNKTIDQETLRKGTTTMDWLGLGYIRKVKTDKGISTLEWKGTRFPYSRFRYKRRFWFRIMTDEKSLFITPDLEYCRKTQAEDISTQVYNIVMRSLWS